MNSRQPLFIACFVLGCFGGSLSGCVLLYQSVEVEALGAGSTSSEVDTPLKVHLHDGSVVLFKEGARFYDGHVWGAGTRYSIALMDSMRVDSVAISRVAAMETFTSEIDASKSAVASVLASGGVFIISMSVLIAILLLGEG